MLDEARLFEAVAAGDVGEVVLALDAGCDINTIRGDADRESDEQPLVVAARAGHRPIVQLLLQRGAAINNGYKGGTPALLEALIRGHLEMADDLYRHGAVAGPLLGYCFTENYGAIHEILHLQPDRWPEYALDSVRAGSVDMLQENLSRNPVITPDQRGFVLARSAIFQWRLVHKVDPPDLKFDRSRFQKMLCMLLEWGVDVNQADEQGNTLLHHCASIGRAWSPTDAERVAHAHILLARGADPKPQNKQGHTASMHAITSGQTDLAELFSK